MSARPELVPPAVQADRLTLRTYESSAGWCVRWSIDGGEEHVWYFGGSEIEARLVARAVRRWAADLGAK